MIGWIKNLGFGAVIAILAVLAIGSVAAYQHFGWGKNAAPVVVTAEEKAIEEAATQAEAKKAAEQKAVIEAAAHSTEKVNAAISAITFADESVLETAKTNAETAIALNKEGSGSKFSRRKLMDNMSSVKASVKTKDDAWVTKVTETSEAARTAFDEYINAANEANEAADKAVKLAAENGDSELIAAASAAKTKATGDPDALKSVEELVVKAEAAATSAAFEAEHRYAIVRKGEGIGTVIKSQFLTLPEENQESLGFKYGAMGDDQGRSKAKKAYFQDATEKALVNAGYVKVDNNGKVVADVRIATPNIVACVLVGYDSGNSWYIEQYSKDTDGIFRPETKDEKGNDVGNYEYDAKIVLGTNDAPATFKGEVKTGETYNLGQYEVVHLCRPIKGAKMVLAAIE